MERLFLKEKGVTYPLLNVFNSCDDRYVCESICLRKDSVVSIKWMGA